MKIRNGFVSNSSSSSFLILSNKKIENIEDVKTVFNMDDLNEILKYKDGKSTGISMLNIAQKILEKLKDPESQDLDEIKHVLGDYEERVSRDIDEHYKVYNWNIHNEKIYSEYLTIFKDYYIYCFDSDDWESDEEYCLNHVFCWDIHNIEYIRLDNY